MESLSAALTSGLRAVFEALFSGSAVDSSLPEGADLPHDTMLLGRALFLNSSLLQPSTEVFGNLDEGRKNGERAQGGRTRVPLIWSVGPGRIFLRAPGDN